MAGRYPYNLIRSRCYFVRYRFKDFDISIPDRIRTNVSACVEWPSKAVRTLADLSVFDGWDLGGIDRMASAGWLTKPHWNWLYRRPSFPRTYTDAHS
ncbi:hypothetical protein ACJ4Z0_00710 [Bifidobacterium catenulatum]|uniref:hypothetical protein n=1 Tax=Bifidobacterium catenulatum TaxID=1686 RepID=UPI003D328764